MNLVPKKVRTAGAAFKSLYRAVSLEAIKRMAGNFVIVMIAFSFYGFVFYNVFEERVTTAQFREPIVPLAALPVCTPADNPVLTDKTVILRVDDIQSHIWQETQLRIIEDTAARNIPTSLGVIPSTINSDRTIVNALRTHSCLHEVVQHGYDHGRSNGHTAPEFEFTTYDEALERITRGLTELSATGLPTPVTWIPPRNNHSADTVKALHELGFKILSVEGTERFDYDTSVTNYDFGSLVEPEAIIAACEETFKTETECVIMIHPQDFVNGPTHNEELYQAYFIDMLDQLEAKGYSFARFVDYIDAL